MKRMLNLIIAVALTAFTLTACKNQNSEEDIPKLPPQEEGGTNTMLPVPEDLSEIPEAYYSVSSQPGTLTELWYDTYESFSYGSTNTPLRKRAILYLPYGYSDTKQYNVLYMMHGGWSNETGLLGTPEQPSNFKNVIDNAIESQAAEAMIIVCPTYNNTNINGQDSDNYSLALELTQNYHNELVNDLIPAVEGKYSSYAESTDTKGLTASRNHRAFMGFSMGSVTTWRVFESCLAYFRYFFPSSGSITASGEVMENMVKASGYSEKDFFIYAMSGTNDFAYAAFTNQIQAMLKTNTFIQANNEAEGNLFYSVKEGYSHNGRAQTEYFYNALTWVWRSRTGDYTADTKISEVIQDSVFNDWGRLIFPVNSNYYSGTTLGNLSLTWYQNIYAGHTVEICNYFKNETLKGNKVFYDIYTEEEKAENPAKKDTGLFFFRGDKNAKFAITCAGGGWAYVGAMHDSFPHALELSKKGYNAFAIIYRPGAQTAYEDLARAISFIFANAEILGVDTDGYSVWGGSAGGRMAATISSYGVQPYGGATGIPKPSAAILQYTGHTDYNPDGEPATFACVGESDGIASYQTMKRRLDSIAAMGVPTEYHSYAGMGHGFGLGIGTIAEGWFHQAVAFWENNC